MDTVDDWLAQWWDDDVAMVWNPPGSFDALFPARSVHLVPPTVWFAIGRLAEGDVDTAARAFDAVIGCQLDTPGAPWHGTFARFREFPTPQRGAIEYLGYDPNWRQFVGTGMALAMRLAPLPSPTTDAMRSAIATAIDGEPPDRVSPDYTNIALMRAWLEVEGGILLDRPEVTDRGMDLAARVVERFDAHHAFDEWNSPTYYGIDLYALRLWRIHSAALASWGERLETSLWADLAPWYHAGLRNMAGPYTRAYGMDMCRYVAAIGLWIGDAVAPSPAPVPSLDGPFSHSHDMSLVPVVRVLGSQPPPGARAQLAGFSGERHIERTVSSDPERVATGWLAPHVMIGAERGARPWSARNQYHPATVHWQEPSGRTRWMRLVHAGPVDARAGPGQLHATCRPHQLRGAQPTSFLLSAASRVEADRWELPGLTVEVRTDGAFVGALASGDLTDARYDAAPNGTTTFELSFSM